MTTKSYLLEAKQLN